MYDPNQFTQTQSMAPMAPMGTAMNVPTGMGGFSAPGMRPQMGMNRDRPDMGPGNNPFSPGYRPQMGMNRDRSDMGPGPRPPGMFGQQPPGMFGQQPPGMFGQQPPGMLAGMFGQQPPGMLAGTFGQQPPGMLAGTFGQPMPQGEQAALGLATNFNTGAVPGGQYNQAIPQQGALGGGFGFSNPFAPQPQQPPGMWNQMPQASMTGQNFMQPPQLPGYAAPQATQPFNLGLGSFNGI